MKELNPTQLYNRLRSVITGQKLAASLVASLELVRNLLTLNFDNNFALTLRKLSTNELFLHFNPDQSFFDILEFLYKEGKAVDDISHLLNDSAPEAQKFRLLLDIGLIALVASERDGKPYNQLYLTDLGYQLLQSKHTAG
jgi:hypothetical protein